MKTLFLDMENAGEYVRSLRNAAGLTQMELSRMLDVLPTYISMIETGKIGKPSVEFLLRVKSACCGIRQFQDSYGDLGIDFRKQIDMIHRNSDFH